MVRWLEGLRQGCREGSGQRAKGSLSYRAQP